MIDLIQSIFTRDNAPALFWLVFLIGVVWLAITHWNPRGF